MGKRILSFLLCTLLVNLLCYGSVTAYSKEEKDAKRTEKVKAAIAKLGIGSDAKVFVKLRDKTKLRGFVSESNSNYFVVADENTGVATTVEYSKVRQVKGNNLSTGTIIAVGVVLAIAIIIAVLTVANEDN